MRRVDFLAVDEHFAIDPQHAKAAKAGELIALLQRIVNLVRLVWRLRRRYVKLVAGLGNELAKPLLKVFRLVNQPQHHLTQAIQFNRQNIGRMVAGWHVRIGIALAAQFSLQNIVSKAAEQLAGIWRAIADRLVKRIFQRIAFMRESWRNVENIARFHLFIDDGLEWINL
mgnify:CR=1 FL=1